MFAVNNSAVYEYHEVGWPHFRTVVRMFLAQYWFSVLPSDYVVEWICVADHQFGTVYYHRFTGEAVYDKPDHYFDMQLSLEVHKAHDGDTSGVSESEVQGKPKLQEDERTLEHGERNISDSDGIHE